MWRRESGEMSVESEKVYEWGEWSVDVITCSFDDQNTWIYD